ncbi:hypothetical protein QJQ45_017713 [Haematococcus lacustris]|nr:hypothetical protein QJQ45_017713 [Haematococcus lacustris]
MERDYETLVPRAPSRTERLAVNHVAKGKSKRSRGADVVFDPAKHNFCSMKVQERLQNCVQHATHVQRRAKLKEELGFDDKWGASDGYSWVATLPSNQIARSQVRITFHPPFTLTLTQPACAVLRTTSEDDEAGPAAVRCGTDRPVEGDPASAAAHKEVRVFKQAGQMTTVKIVPIQLQSDSDVEEEDGGLEDGGLQGAGHGAAQQEQQGAQPRHQAATTQKAKWHKPQKGGVKKGKGKAQQKRKGKGRPQRRLRKS